MNKCYICVYQSWYHFLGLCSFFESLGESQYLIIVHKRSFYGVGSLTDDNTFKKYSKNLEVVDDIDKLNFLIKKYDIRKFTIISPAENPYGVAKILKKNHILFNIVVIDEGLGSYGSIRRSLLCEARDMNVQSLWPFCFCFFAASFKYVVKKILFCRIKKSYWMIFDKDTLVLNNSVVKYYMSALNSLFQKYRYIVVENGRYCLFLSVPYVELGIFSSKDHKEMVNQIACRCDSIFLVKPHPIESVEKYKFFETVDPKIPIEILIKKFSSSTVEVYALSSTCIYTLYVFFGIRCKRLARYDLFYKAMSKKQKIIVDMCSDIEF